MPTGVDNSTDLAFGAGWGPDYGDPLTYLCCFDVEKGDMLNYSGINTKDQDQSEEQAELLKTIGLDDVQAVVDAADAAVGDERIELFAKAEAMLLSGGFLRPFSTSGGSLAVSPREALHRRLQPLWSGLVQRRAVLQVHAAPRRARAR